MNGLKASKLTAFERRRSREPAEVSIQVNAN